MINGMQLTNPNLVYCILYKSITGRDANPTMSAMFLDQYFKAKNKQTVIDKVLGKSKSKQIPSDYNTMRIVLVDELDALVTKKQTLLYNLFDWPSYKDSKLLVIAIANTMDLPERLQSKIASRMGDQRIVYQPYSKE